MAYDAKIGKPGETTHGEKRPRLFAWINEHSSHGLMYDNLCWMPEGDEPELDRWIRAPWMDEPEAPAQGDNSLDTAVALLNEFYFEGGRTALHNKVFDFLKSIDRGPNINTPKVHGPFSTQKE